MKRIFGLLIVALLPGVALAESAGTVNQFYGGFATQIPIDVPRFHGLEPQIKIDYSSGSQIDGFVGVGWGLAAASIIQRGGPNRARGVANFDANDGYTLDGQELMPCTTYGGTHCTRIQSYNRITHNADDTWTVTGKTGVVMTYTPIWNSGTGYVYRWGLSTARDPIGNTVTYHFATDNTGSWPPINETYIDSIEYNGTRIVFYREPRLVQAGATYPTTYATGFQLASINYRLHAIAVYTGGALARAYQLNYDPMNFLDTRSNLTSVVEYGSDAAVDSTGNVSGPTSLPAFTIGWSDPSPRVTQPGPWGNGPFANYGGGPDPATFSLVDVDGDGRADACAHVGGVPNDTFTPPGGVQCLLNNGAGWSYSAGYDRVAQYDQDPPPILQVPGADYVSSTLKFVDINADGKADLCAWNSGCGMQCWLSTGTGWTQPSGYNDCTNGAPVFRSSSVNSSSINYADVDGDGMTDACAVVGSTLHCALSAGTGWKGGFADAGLAYLSDPGSLRFGDLNGDGLADVCWAFNSGYGMGPGSFRCALSTGSGWNPMQPGGIYPIAVSFPSGVWDPATSSLTLVDVNGDGLADACARLTNGVDCVMSSGTIFNSVTGYDSANNGQSVFANNTYGSLSYTAQTIRFADINGDGRADVCGELQSGMRCWLSTGTGWKSFGWSYALFPDSSGARTADVYSTFQVADVTADGTPDFCMRMSTGVQCWPATNGPMLVNQITNGIGGTTNIGYWPSTSYDHHSDPDPHYRIQLPLGMIVQTVRRVTTDDGRGTQSTITYSYDGAKWSSLERTFLGFGYVKSVIDAPGDFTETFYHQHDGCISKPDATKLWLPAGGRLSSSTMEYKESETPPWTSPMTRRTDANCEGTEVCLSTETDFYYDDYANIQETDEWGDLNHLGDERTTYVGYAYNPSKYIVGVMAYQNTYAGLGTSGQTLGPMLRSTRNVYDNNAGFQDPPTQGVLKRRQRWDSTTGNYVDTVYVTDSAGNVRSTTDPMGGTSTTDYDPTYNIYPVKECDALNHCVTTSWNYTLGVATFRTDANGLHTQTWPDSLGRKKKTQYSDGHYVTWDYLNWGDPNQQHTRETLVDGSQDGIWSESWQDGLGRVYKKLAKGRVDAMVTTIQQDILFNDTSQRPFKKSLPYAPVLGETARYSQYAYDALGRVLTITNPDDDTGRHSQSSNSYGGESAGASLDALWTRSTDENGHSTTVYKDAYGRVVKIVENNNATTIKSYDMLDRLTGALDAANNPSSTVYDSFDRVRQVCDPDRGCLTYDYNLTARTTTQTDKNGNVITVTEDALHRPKSKTLPGGKQVNWYYDEAHHGASLGLPTSTVYPDGEDSVVYDSYARPLSTVRCVQGICQSITQSYDALGRVASVTYPDCDKITYHYDEVGRQYSADGLATLQYDARGHVHTVTNTNGTVQTYTYDSGRAWMLSSTVTAGASTLYQASYHYDLAAHVDTIGSTTNPLMALSFVYDDLDRLKTVSGGQSQSLTYDVLGNIQTNSDYGPSQYNYDDPNHKHAVTSIGSDAFTYDNNGNMLTGPGRTMTWDAENRMSSITANGVKTTFAYDAAGQRIRKGSTYYYGPAERQPDGTLAKYFTVGGLLIAKKDSGGTYWYHSDHLGSPRLLTTSSGLPAASYDYSAFGRTVAQNVGITNPAGNPVGFNGQRADAESGLVYMNARYYDPKLARFLSADSVVPSASNPQALNRYSFVYNNPISNTDPTGHVPVAAAWIGIAIAYEAGFTTMAVIGIAGALATTVGYFTQNEGLMIVGEMLTAAFNGPVAMFGWGLMKQIQYSDLSPGVKTAIGWAWTIASTAYSFSQQAAKDPSTPADAPILADKGYKGAETAVVSPEEAWCRSSSVEVTNTSPALAANDHPDVESETVLGKAGFFKLKASSSGITLEAKIGSLKATFPIPLSGGDLQEARDAAENGAVVGSVVGAVVGKKFLAGAEVGGMAGAAAGWTGDLLLQRIESIYLEAQVQSIMDGAVLGNWMAATAMRHALEEEQAAEAARQAAMQMLP